MAISKDKIRIAVTLNKNVITIIDDIVKAAPTKMTRSDVITFAIADFYLSILESNTENEKKGENN